MKPSTIDRRINDLEQELAGLRRKKVALLQEELTKLQSDLNGTRPVKATKGWAAEIVPSLTPTGRKSAGRGKRLSEEEVVDRLRKAVAASGTEGISARAAAQQAGVFYLRAIKAMDGQFVKSGRGKWTRYTIK